MELLHSGKTLVYIKLIEDYIRQGKQVFYLVAGNRTNVTDHPPAAKTFWWIYWYLS